jgi:hypothetical protein
MCASAATKVSSAMYIAKKSGPLTLYVALPVRTRHSSSSKGSGDATLSASSTQTLHPCTFTDKDGLFQDSTGTNF